ncbi:MAG: AAA family ATPase, partial [Cetobacterium sp.]
ENFNILGIPDNIRKNLNKENLSERLENIYSNNNFYIEDIVFNDDISYKNLADGEKQLLSTIGMMLIYQKSISNKKDNIFIFDEPGTHLNPAWKINYVSYLEKILNIENNDGEKTGSQIIFTTHTPEIISDLKKNELHLIKSGEFEEIDKNNLGDTINSINKDLFEKEHTISTRAIEKINKYYDKFHKEFNIYNLINIKNEIIQELGDSAERFELLLEIEKKIKRKSKEGN